MEGPTPPGSQEAATAVRHWRALVARAPSGGAPFADPGDAERLAAAAIGTGIPTATARAAAILADAELDAATRIACARLLAQASRGSEGLAVLLADPAMHAHADAASVLQACLASPDLPRPVAAMAWHMLRRLRRRVRGAEPR